MSTNNQKLLNKYHVIFLAQSSMIGTGLLTLPQRLSSVGYSQALLPLFFGIIASLTLGQMIWLVSKYPNKNLFEINEILLGKILGKGINVLIVLQFIIFCASIISDYMHLIQSTALPEQTIIIPTILFLLLLIYITNGGITTIARFCIMTFFLTTGMVYFTHWAVEKGSFNHIFPLFNYNGQEFFEAFKKGYFTILGYELIMFYFPLIKDQQKAYKHALIGVWISIITCLLTTIVSVMYNSEWQLEHVEFPVLNIFKAGGFSFVERIDIFGMTLWVFLILSTVTVYLWSAKKGVDILTSKRENNYLYFLVIAIFLLVKMPFDQATQEKIFLVSNYGGYMLIVWPIFLGFLYFLRKKQVQ
ncbi:GerAB/ArcD/ProY family transporter [Rummeliibacillus pycnus]|uniref:GerAB/ArcD/ProY family transporter n=1 Tax=Rummeliibacillus pycnus TaxID=101070 RepID=UPI000C9CF431|nr:GerAB/ArcD/ProY family transporter [Rummeliibacillus pycnus]